MTKSKLPAPKASPKAPPPPPSKAPKPAAPKASPKAPPASKGPKPAPKASPKAPPPPTSKGPKPAPKASPKAPPPPPASKPPKPAKRAVPTQKQKRLLEQAIEAILILEHGVVRLGRVKQILKSTSPEDLTEGIAALNDRYAKAQLATRVQVIGESIEMRLVRGFKHPVIETYEKKKTHLSSALIETLAIIAYNQPVTKSDIQHIRGSSSTGALKTLLNNKLIEAAGTKNAPGKPVLYQTTSYFLEFFSVKDLRELPPLQELKSYPFMR